MSEAWLECAAGWSYSLTHWDPLPPGVFLQMLAI